MLNKRNARLPRKHNAQTRTFAKLLGTSFLQSVLHSRPSPTHQMEDNDPNDYDIGPEGDVSYEEELCGKLFFWKKTLVRVIRRQGGAKQVAVQDVSTGRLIGYPSVISLCRLVPKQGVKVGNGTPSNFPSISSASATSPFSPTQPEKLPSPKNNLATTRDWCKLQRKLDRLCNKIAFTTDLQSTSTATPSDLIELDSHIAGLLSALHLLSLRQIIE